MFSNKKLYSSIDLNKTLEIMKSYYSNNKILNVCSSLILAKNTNDTYSFYRSFGIYNEEDNYMYDLLTEKFIQFIDLKNDKKLVNYNMLNGSIKRKKLTNLKKSITSKINKENVLDDLNKVKVLHGSNVKKIYAISINNKPYVLDIYLPINLPSAKIISKTLFFKNEDVYKMYYELNNEKEKIKVKK